MLRGTPGRVECQGQSLETPGRVPENGNGAKTFGNGAGDRETWETGDLAVITVESKQAKHQVITSTQNRRTSQECFWGYESGAEDGTRTERSISGIAWMAKQPFPPHGADLSGTG